MLDRGQIGRTWAPWEVLIEAGRLRLLAKAIGETRPIHVDEAAAKAAGYRGLVAPPTFAFCLLADGTVGSRYLTDVGIPIAEVLHGEQAYQLHGVLCAGDIVRVSRRVQDIYEKKGGALEFVVFVSEVVDVATGEVRAVGQQTMIWRHR